MRDTRFTQREHGSGQIRPSRIERAGMQVDSVSAIAEGESFRRVIPDFQQDAATIAAYNDARSRFEISAAIDAEERTRATFAKRRATIRAEIDAASMMLYERQTMAEKALWDYANRYPLRVEGDTPSPPSFWETVWSFGHAGRMYKHAAVSAAAVTQVQARHRRLEQSYGELDEQLARALFLQDDARRRSLEAPEGLAAFHAQPDIAPLRARFEEIETERAQYPARLAAGGVWDEEQRDRDFARQQISWLEAPFYGVAIVRVVRYGEGLAYFILRDLEGNLYALGYEPRLEALVDRVFDVYWLGDAFGVRASIGSNGLPITLAEHFAANFRDAGDARYEYERTLAELRVPRAGVPAMTFARSLDPASNEGDVIELLAAFADNVPERAEVSVS